MSFDERFVVLWFCCFGAGFFSIGTVPAFWLVATALENPQVMRFVGGPTSRSLWVSVAFFMVCPLTFLKTLDALKVTDDSPVTPHGSP